MANPSSSLGGARKWWIVLLVVVLVLSAVAWLRIVRRRHGSGLAPSAGPGATSAFLNRPLGCLAVQGVTESGFQFQEYNGSEPFRWTNGAAKLVVPIDAEHPPQRLWVSIATYRPKPMQFPFQVLVDGASVFQGKIWTGLWAINLDLSSHRFSDHTTVELRSDTFLPKGVMDGGKNTDTRTLGVQVKGVMLQRDDLAPPDAKKGQIVRGRALDVQGKPLAGVLIAARPIYRRGETSPGASPAERPPCVSLTNQRGEFGLGPLPAGSYDVRAPNAPEGVLIDGRAPGRLADVFLPQMITVNQAPPSPVEFRAMPSVAVAVQCVDSAGKPTAASWFGLGGMLGSASFNGDSEPGSSNGRVVLRAPKGLQRATLNYPLDEHRAFRFRTSKDAPLSNRAPQLGTLSGDRSDITVVCYRAPVLLVRAVSDDGELIRDFKPRVDYPPSKAPLEGKMRSSNGILSDVLFRRQDDDRWRSQFLLLPDEPFTLTVEAPGYKPHSEKLTLPEGAVKELDVTLQAEASK